MRTDSECSYKSTGGHFMIFTDGAWRIAEGFDIHPAGEVRFVQKSEDRITLTMPSFHIYVRGMTLGGPYITMEISSPAENIFHIRTYHFKGDRSLAPSYFALNVDNIPLETEEDENTLIIRSGESSLIINKKDYGYELKRGNRTVTASKNGALAYIDGNHGSFMREQLNLKVGEHT